jgi:hypothetical protein
MIVQVPLWSLRFTAISRLAYYFLLFGFELIDLQPPHQKLIFWLPTDNLSYTKES